MPIPCRHRLLATYAIIISGAAIIDTLATMPPFYGLPLAHAEYAAIFDAITAGVFASLIFDYFI